MDIELIDFLEFEEAMKQLKQLAQNETPELTFVPFWRLSLRDGNKLVLSATVSDGKPGPQGSVELVKELDNAESTTG